MTEERSWSTTVSFYKKYPMFSNSCSKFRRLFAAGVTLFVKIKRKFVHTTNGGYISSPKSRVEVYSRAWRFEVLPKTTITIFNKNTDIYIQTRFITYTPNKNASPWSGWCHIWATQKQQSSSSLNTSKNIFCIVSSEINARMANL